MTKWGDRPGRFCWGCAKEATPSLGGVLPFLDAYWHRACFVKASPEKRAEATAATVTERRRRNGEG